MQQELIFKAITHRMIGIALVTFLLVLLIAMRREINGGEPIRGMVQLGIVVMGLCTFLALMAGLFQAKKTIVPETISSRLDSAALEMVIRKEWPSVGQRKPRARRYHSGPPLVLLSAVLFLLEVCMRRLVFAEP